jgi:hypothetical protein
MQKNDTKSLHQSGVSLFSFTSRSSLTKFLLPLITNVVAFTTQINILEFDHQYWKCINMDNVRLIWLDLLEIYVCNAFFLKKHIPIQFYGQNRALKILCPCSKWYTSLFLLIAKVYCIMLFKKHNNYNAFVSGHYRRFIQTNTSLQVQVLDL